MRNNTGRCKLFFLPLMCLSPNFSYRDFLSYLKQMGYDPLDIHGETTIVFEEGNRIRIAYLDGIVQACSDSEEPLEKIRKRIITYFLAECRGDPEVVLLLTDGKQLEAYPDDSLASKLHQKLRGAFSLLIVLLSFIAPILWSLYNPGYLVFASLASIFLLFAFLLFSPFFKLAPNCIRIPDDARRVFLVRVATEDLSDSDLILFGVVKHLVIKNIRGLDNDKLKNILDEVGIKYSKVLIEELNLQDILKRLTMSFKVKTKLCLVPSPKRNAFTVGLVPRWSRIYVTVGLLLDLSQQEFEAVLAHEFAHIKRHDLLRVFTMLGAEYITRTFLLSLFYIPLPLLLSYFLIYTYAVANFLQRLEYNADKEACKKKYDRSLLRALIKLEFPALMRSEKLSERLKGRVLPSSHPPPFNRIMALLQA
ncbi:MAG: M48 family metalloprotease [Infirmifilum sp.]